MSKAQDRRVKAAESENDLNLLLSMINQTDVAIKSATDSLKNYWIVISVAVMLGTTVLGTKMYDGKPFIESWFQALFFGLLVFALFDMGKHFLILLDRWYDNTYMEKLNARKSDLSGGRAGYNPAAQYQQAAPTPSAQHAAPPEQR